jgi:hypothetical protein
VAVEEVGQGWRLGWVVVGGWRLAVGGWRLAVGGWRLAVGGWRLAVTAAAADVGEEVPVAAPQEPVNLSCELVHLALESFHIRNDIVMPSMVGLDDNLAPLVQCVDNISQSGKFSFLDLGSSLKSPGFATGFFLKSCSERSW